MLALLYAVFLRVLYNICYDLRWDRPAQALLAHKFHLFPELRSRQIEQWVRQLQSPYLFPNGSEPELRQRAQDLVMGFLI